MDLGKKYERITAPTRNWRFSASYDSFVVQQTLVLRMNICGKNRQLLVAAKRYAPCTHTIFKDKILYLCTMPTILLIFGWRIFFYSNEGNEPIHVHAQKGDMECKFWLNVDTFEIIEAFSYNLSPSS